MTKTLLITRPKGDEQGLTNTLHNHGYRVIHEPLMEIVLQHQERHAVHRALMEEPDAVLVTSRHGVQSLAFLTDIRDVFLICVGESTAKSALSAGFSRISTCGGNARQMMEYILASYDKGSRFVYVSALDVRTDLAIALQEEGMQVERIITYEAEATQQLSDTLIEQLKRQQIDGVTFLSQRTAEIFTHLLKQYDISDVVTGLRAFCMSEAVADALLMEPWFAVHVSQDTTLSSLVHCIDNVFLTNG